MLQVSFSPVAVCGIATYISANLKQIFAKLQRDGKITEEGNCIGKANQRKIQQYNNNNNRLEKHYSKTYMVLTNLLCQTYNLWWQPREKPYCDKHFWKVGKKTIGISALHLGTWKSRCISCSSVMECRMSACSVTLLWSAVLFDCLSTSTCCSRRLVFFSSTSHLWFKVNRQRLLSCILSWYS